ncbi:Lactoylglutathione lyase [Klebsiella variicola]|uniref:Lactoylglutathione lyase n=1 Tax=Klebsiella variicola TaxID=244366 RepID=A0A7H4MLV0_KLEVA|nr:Lactoylglutathione lyase [Klebsiella variicola]
MFDHVKFGASDYAASKAFFLQALAPLGVTLVGEGEPSYGAELAGSGDVSLCLYQSTEKPAPLHIAFRATAASRSMPSGRRRWPPEERTTARRGYGQTTTPVITPPL